MRNSWILLLIIFTSINFCLKINAKNEEDDNHPLYVNRTEGLTTYKYRSKAPLKNKIKANGIEVGLGSNKVVGIITDNKVKQTVESVRNVKSIRDNSESRLKKLKREIAIESKKGLSKSKRKYYNAKLSQANKELEVSKMNYEKAKISGEATKKGIYARQKRYKKYMKRISVGGRVLTVYTSYNQSFYIDPKTGERKFSTGLFFKNSVINLTGLSTFINANEAGKRAEQLEYNRILDKYKAEGREITSFDLYKARIAARKKRFYATVYEGSKFFSMASDALNVYELSEATIGYYYDNMKSEETINKNNIEIEERAKKSAAGLLDLFEKIRGYNTSLKCEINRSELLERNYNGCKKQYAILYARYAKRASFIRVAAEMKDTSIKAKGFLKESYINRLKTDSKRLMGAIDPTIRLIEISASSGDKQGFNTAKSEAISLLNNLKRYKSACDRSKKALSSVARASAITNNYQSVNSEIIKDEQAYSSLIQEMGGYIRLQQAIDRKSREFYSNIIKNTQIFKRASAYFIKHTENTDVISQVKLLQVRASVYEPSEYDIKKIKERTNLLIGNFTHLRDISFNKIEFSSSDVADIEAAKRVLNEVVTTGKAIENKIALTEAKLRRLHLIPEKDEIEEDSEEVQEEKLAKQQEEYENQLKLEREQNKELERKQREFQEEKKRKHNNRAAIMRRIAELKKKKIADVQRLEKEKRDDPDRARNKKEALSFKGKPREMTCPKCGFNGLHYWFGDRWSCPTCGYCTMLSEIKRPGGMTYAEYARKIIERYDQKILKVKKDADEEIRRLEEELRE